MKLSRDYNQRDDSHSARPVFVNGRGSVGFSDLFTDVFGPAMGRHARSAIGVSELPLGFTMEFHGKVLIST